MQLFETKIGTLPNALYYEGIEERDIACLYYLIEGRNAWHSTWTNWYRDGCMHTTLDAAKMSAERQRKPGSKFYIREIPALVLKSESSILLSTQINTRMVLDRYLPYAVHDCFESRDAKECQIEEGCSIHDAYKTLIPSSGYWEILPPPRDSVVQFILPRENTCLFSYNGSISKIYTSFVSRYLYKLGWSGEDDHDRSVYLKKILAFAQS